jgi:hypothetical protein
MNDTAALGAALQVLNALPIGDVPLLDTAIKLGEENFTIANISSSNNIVAATITRAAYDVHVHRVSHILSCSPCVLNSPRNSAKNLVDNVMSSLLPCWTMQKAWIAQVQVML